MKAPNITRRDLLAALVGAVVAGALLAAVLLSPFRWQLSAPVVDRDVYAYQLDRWTGRAWILCNDEREPVRDHGDATTPTAATVRGALAFGVVFAAVVAGAVVLSRRNS